MKTEKPILILISLSILAFAIFTSYNTPAVDQSSETEYRIDIENYKSVVSDKILADAGRMNELTRRFEISKEPDRSSDKEKLVRLRKEFNEMQTTLNNYEANGWEEWKLFKERFENELTEQHELLINLIIKRSNSLNNDKSIQSFVKK